jgi:hypothetical protein
MPPLATSRPIQLDVLSQQLYSGAAFPFLSEQTAIPDRSTSPTKIDPAFISVLVQNPIAADPTTDKEAVVVNKPSETMLKESVMELSDHEREDLAAFLSDVDLSSEDEEVYKNEDHLSQIYAQKHARHPPSGTNK